MNESENNRTIGEAVFGIIVIFTLLALVVFSFKSQHKITTPEDTSGELATSSDLSDSAEAAYYSDFLEAIKNNNSGGTAQFEKIISDKTAVPEPSVFLKNLGIYDATTYLNNFDKIWAQKYNKGLLDANKIFIAQSQSTEFLTLSDADKSDIISSAILFKDLADELEAMPTPNIYKSKSEAAVKSARKVAYVLEKIIGENDEKIYTLWVVKYSQYMQDLNAAHYVK